MYNLWQQHYLSKVVNWLSRIKVQSLKSLFLHLVACHQLRPTSCVSSELPPLPKQQEQLQPGVRDAAVLRLHLRQHHGGPRSAWPLHQREKRGPHQPNSGEPDRVLPRSLPRKPGARRDGARLEPSSDVGTQCHSVCCVVCAPQNCIATHESNGIDIIIALILNDINPLGKKRMDLVLELKVSSLCSSEMEEALARLWKPAKMMVLAHWWWEAGGKQQRSASGQIFEVCTRHVSQFLRPWCFTSNMNSCSGVSQKKTTWIYFGYYEKQTELNFSLLSEQCIQIAARYHGESTRQRECREDSVQHEAQRAGEGLFFLSTSVKMIQPLDDHLSWSSESTMSFCPWKMCVFYNM